MVAQYHKKIDLVKVFRSKRVTNRLESYSIEQLFVGFFMALAGISMTLLLSNTSSISSDMNETRSMISTLQQKVDKLQKTCDKFEYQKEESNQMGNEMIKETINEALNVAKPLFVFENVEKKVENRDILTSNPIYKINAASYVLGAEVDTSRSSNSSLYRFFGDESEQVLVDRLDPPARKAWCSTEKEPVLTVDLAKFIKPTAISYQHFKWNHIVPDGAPKIFDVVACIDFSCEQTVPLVSNFEYKSNDKKQEQIYPISPFPNASLIGKVQFRFRKNHGNVKETCVSLVRVYGETDIAKEVPRREEPTMHKLEYCSKLRNNYHNSPFIYRYFNSKDCKVLDSYECCTICPECCEDCPIFDISLLIVFSLIVFVSLTFAFCVFSIAEKSNLNSRNL
uniref:SUN domain-containing protein n=1 Tax=Caenorhabditis tropicalis TaxID=1561998 RepID=A0A1I7THS0_9PELO